MKFIGGFFQFAEKVLDSSKKGGLPFKDQKKLDNLLKRTGKRNTVLAKGLLSAMTAGGASENDIRDFGEILERAEKRIEEDKEPFTKKDSEDLSEIFKRSFISQKTEKWFHAQLDDLLAGEIKEFISGTRRMDIQIPKKTELIEYKEVKENKEGKRIRV